MCFIHEINSGKVLHHFTGLMEYRKHTIIYRIIHLEKSKCDSTGITLIFFRLHLFLQQDQERYFCSLLFYSTRQFNLIEKSIQGIYAELDIHLILKKKDCVKRSASIMTTLFCLTHPLDISFPPLLVPSLFSIHLSTCAIHT